MDGDFLTAPTIHEKSVHSVLAFGMSVKKPVKCALVEFSLQRRKVSSIPFKGYSGRTFLSRDSLGVSYSAGNEIRRYDSKAREQRVLTSYPKGAFGPPVSSKDKNYCIHLATDSNSTSSIKELIGFQKASLVLYKQRNDLVVYKPPVFHEPIGAYQATGVYAFERWKDYLVGHTFFTVFVINIRTGHFGSWRSFEGGVVKSAVSKSGMIAVITRSGKLMVLPVMLIEKLRTGRFTDN